MKITLNGESREAPDGLNVAQLLAWLKLPEDRVAVELNLKIIQRTVWAKTAVAAGDRLEVVHLVGGGSQ